MYFFTSDTHFGSDEILLREKRPFEHIEEFEDYVINLWNSQTKKDDIIYFLGDYINYYGENDHTWKRGLETVKRVKAKVILIMGNNEQRVMKDYFGNRFEPFKKFCKELGFYDVKKEEYLKIGRLKLYLNHYPSKHKDGYLNLFGHIHRTTGLWKPFGLNMDCDLNYFYLYSQKDIEELNALKIKFWDKDKECLSF